MSYVRVMARKPVVWPAICACCGVAGEPLVAYKAQFFYKTEMLGGGMSIIRRATGEIQYLVCNSCKVHIKYCETVMMKMRLCLGALIVGSVSPFLLAFFFGKVIIRRIPILESDLGSVLFFALPFVVMVVLMVVVWSWRVCELRDYALPSPTCKVKTEPIEILDWKPFLDNHYPSRYLPQAGMFILRFVNRKEVDELTRQFSSINSSVMNAVEISDDESEVDVWKGTK
jgi:hypothetical protein